MKKKITLQNVLLTLLIFIVLWQGALISDLTANNLVYIQNQDSNYSIVKTGFGGFPISILETKRFEDRTDLSLVVLNPLNLHFKDAEILVSASNTTERVVMDLLPGANKAKFKIPPIERGEDLTIELKLDRIAF